MFFCAAECALLLLAHNAPVKVKNAQGWSPLAEAISYGDRQMSKDLGYFISKAVFLNLAMVLYGIIQREGLNMIG